MSNMSTHVPPPYQESTNNCQRGVIVTFADIWRNIAERIHGVSNKDTLALAELSLSSSINELKSAESRLNNDLKELVVKVRQIDPQKQRATLNENLTKSRAVRTSLANLQKKRITMEQHMETLQQSQLNQTMLVSMKHTTNALQTMGLQVAEADNIMIDLEEHTGDLNALQNTLASSIHGDNEFSQTDLEDELALMLSEDALCAMHAPTSITTKCEKQVSKHESSTSASTQSEQTTVHTSDDNAQVSVATANPITT